MRPKKWDGLVSQLEQKKIAEAPASADNVQSESEPTGMPSVLDTFTEKQAEKNEVEAPVEPENRLKRDIEVARLSVFRQLSHDGEIHVETLCEALGLLDFPLPNQSWVMEIVPIVTQFRALGPADFLSFVNLYNERQMRAYQEEFNRYDEDGSGEVDASELAQLLKGFGITPLPGILEENIAEVDVDGSGKLNVDEFILVLELQKSREGFSKSEVEEFQKAFKKFDRDHSGEVSSEELLGIVSWLGYPQRPTVVRKIIKRADADGTGDLSWTEMLTCMRWIRESEVQYVHELLARHDADGSGEVDREELLDLLRELGYTATKESIQDAVEDAKLGKDDQGFDFSELWKLLQVFRRRCGFTRTEDADLIAAHTRYDNKKEGFINTLELGKAIRLLGYSVPVATQKKLLELVDVDNSGRLDLAEFRTLMRLRREFELQEMKDVFMQYANDEQKLTAADSCRALRRAGFIGAKTMTEGQRGLLDFEDFWKIVSGEFQVQRERMRQSAGFTSAEVNQFRKMFSEFDDDGSGDIAGEELRKLMRVVFPDTNVSAADRKVMEDILSDVDQDGSGSIDFPDFLRLMRHVSDEYDRQEYEKMWEGFSDDEVAEFRAIFEATDVKGTGHLSPAQVISMIQRIATLDAQGRGELSKMLYEVQKGKESVDFNGFLRIMRQVIDVDLGGINEHAKHIAAVEMHRTATGHM